MRILSICFLIGSLYQHGLSQDGSLIANMKTSHVDAEIKASFSGLWEVTEVKAGSEIVTPVAKWFQINEDGTSTGGNGWLQNVESTWTFDDVNREILFTTDGIPDEYGAFLLKHEGDQMTWSRMEEGMALVVKLKKVDKKPLGPWEKIVAIWKWTGMETLNLESNTVTIADVESDWTRIRWDRRYVTMDASGKITERGIWHIDGHRPVITIFDDKGERYTWQIEFKGDSMIWTHTKDSKKTTLLFEKTTVIGN